MVILVGKHVVIQRDVQITACGYEMTGSGAGPPAAEPFVNGGEAFRLPVPRVLVLDEPAADLADRGAFGRCSLEKFAQALADGINVGSHFDAPARRGQLGEMAGGRDQAWQTTGQSLEDGNAETLAVTGKHKRIGRPPDLPRPLSGHMSQVGHLAGEPELSHPVTERGPGPVIVARDDQMKLGVIRYDPAHGLGEQVQSLLDVGSPEKEQHELPFDLRVLRFEHRACGQVIEWREINAVGNEADGRPRRNAAKVHDFRT